MYVCHDASNLTFRARYVEDVSWYLIGHDGAIFEAGHHFVELCAIRDERRIERSDRSPDPAITWYPDSNQYMYGRLFIVISCAEAGFSTLPVALFCTVLASMIPPAANASSPATALASSANALVPIVPSLDNTYGALLIATFVGLMQYGWTAHQCYQYIRMYRDDGWLLKSLVTTVLTLETFHTVLCMHFCYYYLAKNFFHLLTLANGVWSINVMGGVTSCVVVVSQIFFLRRVYVFKRSYRPLVIFCAFLLLAELGFGMGASVSAILSSSKRHTLVNSGAHAWMNSAGVGIAALADTLLTAALIVSLHRSRSMIKQTDGLIDVLILYAINTGLVTG